MSRAKEITKKTITIFVNAVLIITIVTLICTSVISIMLYSAVWHYNDRERERFMPNNFPGTVWRSEEIDAQLHVEEERTVLEISTEDYSRSVISCMYGTVKYNGEQYEFFVDEDISFLYLTFVSTDIIDYYENGGTEKYEEKVKEFTLFKLNLYDCRKERFIASFDEEIIKSDYVKIRFFEIEK